MLGGLCFWGCRCLYLQSCAICFFVHMCSPSLWSSLEEINVNSSRWQMGCSFLKVQKQVATLQHSGEIKLYCHCNRVERTINRVCFHLTCLSWEWKLRCEGECWKNICSLLLSWSLKSRASNVLLGMNFDAMCFMQSSVIKKCGSRYATGNEAWDHLCFMQWTEIENCVEGMWPLTWCWYHFIFLVLHWLIKWPLAEDNTCDSDLSCRKFTKLKSEEGALWSVGRPQAGVICSTWVSWFQVCCKGIWHLMKRERGRECIEEGIPKKLLCTFLGGYQ